MIYTIGGTKGGTGKSTIATHLAASLTARRTVPARDVLLVDTDETGTSTDFSALRDNTYAPSFTCIQLSDKRVRTELLRMKDKYDDIVIDCGARDTVAQRAALSITDVYIVPFAPRSYDIWTLEQVCNLIEEARVFNENLKAFSLINRGDPSGSDNDDAYALLAERNDTMRVLAGPIIYRKAFNAASNLGLTVHEYRKENGDYRDVKAVSEMDGIFEQIDMHIHIL